MDHKKLLHEINCLFSSKPEALAFTNLYCQYCHAIDDIIDEEYPPKGKSKFIIDAFELAERLFSSHYFISNYYWLKPVIAIVRNDYSNACLWEEESEDWKKLHADVLRHSGYNVFFAIVEHEFGWAALSAISARFREFSHHKHLNDILCYPLSTDTKTVSA